jgi:DNA-directed RNA polymerase subunit M/transcription elongation factor TFIIS
MFSVLYRVEDKGSKYFNRAKSIAMNIQDKKNKEFRERIISQSITPEELIVMDVKEMANSELQSMRRQAEEEGFKSRRSDWQQVHGNPSVGMYKCEICQGEKTTSNEMQIRGADEPMTL